MTAVALIGDSIRLGYQDTVQTELASWADIWGPHENGGTSKNILAHLDDWVIARQPDLVHINCGLHDLRKEFGQTAPVVPLDVYERNLRTLLTRIKQETDATVIWALTTPVNHERHRQNKPFDRFEDDVAAYNTVARQVAQELNIAVNDLFSVVIAQGRDNLLLQDGVHYTPEGYALLGKAVAACIKTNARSLTF